MKDGQGSRLWEKVAAGFLGIFAIREAGKIVNSVITFVFLCIVFSCFAIWFVTN